MRGARVDDKRIRLDTRDLTTPHDRGRIHAHERRTQTA